MLIEEAWRADRRQAGFAECMKRRSVRLAQRFDAPLL
jgi:hypothetical protein